MSKNQIVVIIAAPSVLRMSVHPPTHQCLSSAWNLGPSYPVCISVFYMLLCHETFLGQKNKMKEMKKVSGY